MSARVTVGDRRLKSSVEYGGAEEAKMHATWKVSRDFRVFGLRVIPVIEVAVVLQMTNRQNRDFRRSMKGEGVEQSENFFLTSLGECRVQYFMVPPRTLRGNHPNVG